MDEKNNKLEDFFNQSLNQFDDSPSDAVWEGLQKRMDSERTILEKWTTTVRKLFPYLLLLIGLGTYHFFSQNKINQLTQNLERIKSENSTLTVNLENCDTKETELLTKNQLLSAELNQLATSITALEQSVNKYSAQRNRNYSPMSNESAITVFSPTNERRQLDLQPFNPTPDKNFKLDTYVLIETKASESKVGVTKVEESKLREIVQRVKKTQPDNISPFLLPLRPKLTTTLQPRFSIQHSNALIRGLRIEQDQEVKESNFRIGYQYLAFKTFVKTSTCFNFGNAHGIRMEKVFKNNFALTASVNYVDQEYKIKNGNNPIRVEDLLPYPGGVSFGDNVTSVEVQSHHLNLPLGLKWTVRTWKNNFQFYVNPSLVWQMYFPQKFTYEISGDSKIDRKNKQYFGNFGSGNLQLGLEKKLSESLVWQIGIWGERTIAPVGIENQNLTYVGLNTSILFQN